MYARRTSRRPCRDDPLSDENPTRTTPYVTYALVAINMPSSSTSSRSASQVEGFIRACGFLPDELVTGRDLPPPTCVSRRA